MADRRTRHLARLIVCLLSFSVAPACGTGTRSPAAPSTDSNTALDLPQAGGTDPTADSNAAGADGNALVIPIDGADNVPPTAGGVLPDANAASATALVGGPNNAYTLVGRFDAANPNAVRFSLPNSRIGLTFTGSEANVLLSGDGTDVVGVQVDNNPVVVLTTSPNAVAVAYPIATGLAPGPHTLWLTKRTEAHETSQLDTNVRTGQLTFWGVQLGAGGALGPHPLPKSRLIVVLGDSSTTGYGVGQLQSGTPCVFTPQTQNAELSVPGQLATQLQAEVINVSASGKGLVQSAYDLTNTDQLPSLWRKTVPPAATPNYTFAPLAVGAVLVSVGSDDLVGAYGSGTIADEALFVSTYAELLADMRSHYPQALLVAIVNPNAVNTDRSTLISLLDQAVAVRTGAGDAKVVRFDYFAQDATWRSYNDADAALGLGHGCQGHASPAGSAFLAGRLADLLKAQLAW